MDGCSFQNDYIHEKVQLEQQAMGTRQPSLSKVLVPINMPRLQRQVCKLI